MASSRSACQDPGGCRQGVILCAGRVQDVHRLTGAGRPSPPAASATASKGSQASTARSEIPVGRSDRESPLGDRIGELTDPGEPAGPELGNALTTQVFFGPDVARPGPGAFLRNRHAPGPDRVLGWRVYDGAGLRSARRRRSPLGIGQIAPTGATAGWDPRSGSGAPFVELQDRHSTAVLPMSNGAPPAASGTT